MKKQKTQNGKHKIPKTNNGITLIALVITIVLNCSYLAMVVGKSLNTNNKIIEKIRNLLYNKEGNIKVTKILYRRFCL